MLSNKDPMKAFAQIKAELDKITQMTPNKCIELLTKHGATLDKARKDTIANLKAILICVSYVEKCDNKKVSELTGNILGEEDMNLSLLVNVEAALRAREEKDKIDLPSLKSEIEATLNNVKKNSDSIKVFLNGFNDFRKELSKYDASGSSQKISQLFSKKPVPAAPRAASPTSPLSSSSSPSTFAQNRSPSPSESEFESKTPLSPGSPKSPKSSKE